jgi:hypothetical protein
MEEDSRPVRYTRWERDPFTHWIRGWVGFRGGLDAAEKRRISCPCRESNYDSSIIQPVALPLYQMSYTWLGCEKLRELGQDSQYSPGNWSHYAPHIGTETTAPCCNQWLLDVLSWLYVCMWAFLYAFRTQQN